MSSVLRQEYDVCVKNLEQMPLVIVWSTVMNIALLLSIQLVQGVHGIF